MTADVQLSRIPTHANGSKVIINVDVAFYQAITVVIRVIIRYVVCGQVQIADIIYIYI